MYDFDVNCLKWFKPVIPILLAKSTWFPFPYKLLELPPLISIVLFAKIPNKENLPYLLVPLATLNDKSWYDGKAVVPISTPIFWATPANE